MNRIKYNYNNNNKNNNFDNNSANNKMIDATISNRR